MNDVERVFIWQSGALSELAQTRIRISNMMPPGYPVNPLLAILAR